MKKLLCALVLLAPLAHAAEPSIQFSTMPVEEARRVIEAYMAKPVPTAQLPGLDPAQQLLMQQTMEAGSGTHFMSSGGQINSYTTDSSGMSYGPGMPTCFTSGSTTICP
ncbi:hypothetical protein VPH49_21910 [Pseudomonas luteola]|uniref:hypothetical protein n=1 Tax=Pseudomonas luteola TaxID=47886 RepID=UPI003A839D71